MSKSRNWCFTLNNYPINFEIPCQLQEVLRLYVQCPEVGESNTPHLQGYVEVKHPITLNRLKKLWKPHNPHLEIRRGTRSQAVQYCLKDECPENLMHLKQLLKWNPDTGELSSETEEVLLNSLGTTTSGTRSEKLKEIRTLLVAGSSSEQIADQYFEEWVRHYRAFEHYALLKTTPRNHAVTVHVLQGPTGTGKSKWCMDNFPEAYWKQRSNWWDGYLNHETVIIDEFYGWLPFDLILRICDRYPLMVETKGGQVQFTAKTIVFTTNSNPVSWYKSCYFPSFIRRVHFWHILPVWGIHEQLTNYNEFASKVNDNILLP